MKITKKLLAIALSLIMACALIPAAPVTVAASSVSVGDVIPFGNYNWRVLDVQDGKALLLSETVIRQRMPYHTTYNNITWAQSSIRTRLNGSFYNSFSAEDRARILETNVVNNDHPWYGTRGGADTTDKIFLLSVEEVVRYFGDSGQLGSQPLGHRINDRFNAARIATNGTDADFWHLRTPGNIESNAVLVSTDGTIAMQGNAVHFDRGIRPALWLNIGTAATASSVSVGDVIPFGNYNWRVLDVQDGKALLLSETVIRQRMPYHTTYNNITWAQSSIRTRLNGSFYNSFSAEDRARILETNVVNNDHPWYGTRGGADTTDKIFLLSVEEVVRYFGDSGQLGSQPLGHRINDRFNAARIATNGTDADFWHLRTPGNIESNAVLVSTDGTIAMQGNAVHFDRGIRPALWVNIDATGATPPPPLFSDIATITADQLAQLTLVNERGLMMGSGGRFNPFDRITNMQFITVMSRMANPGIADGNPWYQPHLDWAAGIGITGFDRDAFLTRDNMALWFYKYVLSTGITPEIVRDDTPAFTDIGGLSADYQEAILAMYEWGITVGTTAGTVFGLGNAERIAIAVIIGRFVSRNMP